MNRLQERQFEQFTGQLHTFGPILTPVSRTGRHSHGLRCRYIRNDQARVSRVSTRTCRRSGGSPSTTSPVFAVFLSHQHISLWATSSSSRTLGWRRLNDRDQRAHRIDTQEGGIPDAHDERGSFHQGSARRCGRRSRSSPCGAEGHKALRSQSLGIARESSSQPQHSGHVEG